MHSSLDLGDVSERAQSLSDIELAMLLSLIGKQHTIIESDAESADAIEQGIQMARFVFGLSVATVHCSPVSTFEDFAAGLLVPILDGKTEYAEPDQPDSIGIAEIIIARNLCASSHQVQMQALELLRTKRLFTHARFYTVPKTFLFIVLSSLLSPLNKHLNDFLYLSHFHKEEDGLPNIENEPPSGKSQATSQQLAAGDNLANQALFPVDEIEQLQKRVESVTVSVEIRRYIHDTLTFLRMHRAVASGVTPRATKDFEMLARCLALLHGLDYVTPSLVDIAAKKVYRHRLALVEPGDERSMQYGSDLAAVKEILKGLTPTDIIEDVLRTVDAPW